MTKDESKRKYLEWANNSPAVLALREARAAKKKLAEASPKPEIVDEWVTSDTHFLHDAILTFESSTRQYRDREHMTEELIARWNSRVKPNDNVYHLGDFGFAGSTVLEPIIERLNGNKHYVFGNHDHPMRKTRIAKHFVWMKDYAEIKIDGHKICLSHYPIFEWNSAQHGSLHFHGHLHSNRVVGRSMDVGCESNNCYPHNIRDLITKLMQNDIVTHYHKVSEQKQPKLVVDNS